MFQEKDRMEYVNRKAPDELKNRTWSSIQQEKRKTAKQMRQGMYLAACFAVVLLAGNLMYQNSTIEAVWESDYDIFGVNKYFSQHSETQGEIIWTLELSNCHSKTSEEH